MKPNFPKLTLSVTLTLMSLLSSYGRADAGDMMKVTALPNNSNVTTHRNHHQLAMVEAPKALFANSVFIQPSSWYVGLSAGTVSTKDNALTIPPASYGSPQASQYGSRSYSYGIFAGYDWNINPHVTFGTEASLSQGIATSTITSSIDGGRHDDHRFQNKANYSLSILPTLALTDRGHLFARIGYREGTIALLNNITINPSSPQPNVSQSVSGLLYGLGYSLEVLSHYTLRAEYDIVKYKQEIIQPSVNGVASHHYYTAHEIMLSIIYKFQALAQNPNEIQKLSLIGPYAGIGLGSSNLNTDFSVANKSMLYSYNYSNNSALINGHLGYGLPVAGHYYLGGEAYYQRNHYNASITQVSARRSLTLQSKGEYGADILPGIQLGENDLVYLHLGLAMRTLNLSYNPDTEQTNTYNNESHSLGYRLGLGFETGINQHLSLRFDYVHTQFNKSSLIATDTNSRVTSSPDSDAVSIGINYRIF